MGMDFGKGIGKKVMLATALFTMGVGVVPVGVSDQVGLGGVSVEASGATYKTKASLNMRTGASVKYKRILTIPKGKNVTYVGKRGSWYKVKYGSKTGYVSSKYLTKVSSVKKTSTASTSKKTTSVKKTTDVKSSSVKYVTTADLNMRTGASVKYKRIVTIPRGKTVEYVGKSGTWYKVKYGSKVGYVSSKYLKTSGSTTTKKVASKVVNYPAPSTNTPGFYKGGILVVNKKYSLPSNYNPGIHRGANTAMQAMLAEAKRSGVSIQVISSYRSYSYQASLYNRYKSKYGQKEADRFSARPGHSEHQTGLAFDFGGYNKSHWLEESFDRTSEGKWLATNAHKYGYVLRYPKGKEGVTGYMYEPWHFRYVGTDLATKIKASGKTIEEYLGVRGK